MKKTIIKIFRTKTTGCKTETRIVGGMKMPFIYLKNNQTVINDLIIILTQ